MKALLIIALLLAGCEWSNDMEGEIVKDRNGKYYELTNDKVIGHERYRLIEVDTTKFTRF